MKLTGVLAVVVLALALATSAVARSFQARTLQDAHVGKSKTELKAQMAYSEYVIEHFKRPAVRWRLLPRHSTCWTVASRTLRLTCNRARTRYYAHRWLYAVAKQKYESLYAPKQPAAAVDSSSWLVGAFECIHGYEGAWDANTGNGYYGGLQFDSGSWTANGGQQYAPTANLATPAQQLAVAIAYYHRSGFAPWPNTARYCGLL